MKKEPYVRLTPRRAAVALALTALALVPAGTASAQDISTYCIDLPAVYLGGDQTMSSKELCIPWPF